MYPPLNFPWDGASIFHVHSTYSTWEKGERQSDSGQRQKSWLILLKISFFFLFGDIFDKNIWPCEHIAKTPLWVLEEVHLGEGPWHISFSSFTKGQPLLLCQPWARVPGHGPGSCVSAMSEDIPCLPTVLFIQLWALFASLLFRSINQSGEGLGTSPSAFSVSIRWSVAS